MTITQKISQFYRTHQRWVPIATFVLGFVFDMMVLDRVDELAVLVQQAIYLLISTAIITAELTEASRPILVPPILKKFWKYHEAILHFLLGTLLNSYTIFFFKSASGISSFVFVALLVVLLTLSEFKHFGKSQVKVHVALLSLCLISYLETLSPIVIGFIGIIPFLVGMAMSCGLFYFYFKGLKKKIPESPDLLKTHVLYPFSAIQTLFATLYFLHLIPPIPLSVKYMGIFHQVKKENGEYLLIYSRPDWKFWQHGDQTFYARPGDTIFCYAQIFSPARFKDDLQFRWLYLDEKRGWQASDAIPMPIVGGREEGFRGVTKKNNFQPGQWRVQVETRGNQEVGRINFTVINDESLDIREFHTLIK